MALTALTGSLPSFWPGAAGAAPVPAAERPEAPRFTAIELIAPTGINMRTAGARGDGVSDDSERVQRIIDQAPDNTRFYFPAGTYRLASVAIAGRSRLEFYGDGAATVLRWSGAGLPDSWTPIMTFTAVSDVLIRDLAVDNRSIPSYGGVVFYAARRVEIRNTRVTDSSPRPPAGIDRYAYVFGHGDAPHEDIKIHDNAIANLQLEVDHAQRVQIRNNMITRGTQTAGIGLFSVASGAVMRDYLIEGNVIVDPEPPASGIAVHVDPPTDGSTVFERIRIAHNSIVLRTAATVGISIGTPYVPARTTGNVFRDVAVERNLVRVHASAPPSAELLRMLSNGDFGFRRLAVTGNLLLGHGRLAGDVDASAQIRYPQEQAVIAGNVVRQAVNGLIVVAARDTVIAENTVAVASGVAFAYAYPEGGNTFVDNYVAGAVSVPVEYREAPHPTDIAETPAPAPTSPSPRIRNVRVSNVTTTSATVTWDTDTPTTSEVEYSVDRAYGLTTHPRLPLVSRHTLALVDLRPGTAYNVRVRSMDAAAVEATSARYTFRTHAPSSRALKFR